MKYLHVQTLKETGKSRRERETETHWMELEHLKNVVAYSTLRSLSKLRGGIKTKNEKKWISISTKWIPLPGVGLIALKVVENYGKRHGLTKFLTQKNAFSTNL